MKGSRVATHHRPSTDAVATALNALGRDTTLVLEDRDEEEVYVQVWLRDDGLFQLECRDGGPATHRRVLTVSAEKVERAVLAWRARDDDWDAGIDWTDVSAEFS